MSEINKQAGKYDDAVGRQPQSSMYGAVIGGINGVRNRFESAQNSAEKLILLKEALQYEEEGIKFIIDIFQCRNQENFIKKILFKNPDCSELIINKILEKQPAKFLKVIAIKHCIENWNKFRENNINFIPNFCGIDLSGLNLSNANLSGINLSNANLNGARLWEADLSNVNLFGANLSNANLSRSWLWKADLNNAELIGANISHADLSNVNLTDTYLKDANLTDTDLSGANLNDANLIDDGYY